MKVLLVCKNKNIIEKGYETLEKFVKNTNGVEFFIKTEFDKTSNYSLVSFIDDDIALESVSFSFGGNHEEYLQKIKGVPIILSQSGNIGFLKEDPYYNRCYNLFVPGNPEKRFVIAKIPQCVNKYFIFNTTDNKLTTSRTYCQREPRCFRSDVLKCFYYVISKNCCSAVTNLLYKVDVDNSIPDDWDPWDFKQNIKDLYKSSIFVNNISQHKESKLKDYRRFVILRDPVSRFLSLINYTKDKTNPVGHPYMFKYQDTTDKHLFIEFVLTIMQGLFAIRDIWYHDDHFMAQSQHLNGVNLDEIDDFVMIEDAISYFKEIYNVNLPFNNVTKTKFITKEDISEAQLEEIKKLWASDYELLKNVTTWRPKCD